VELRGLHKESLRPVYPKTQTMLLGKRDMSYGVTPGPVAGRFQSEWGLTREDETLLD